MRMLAVQKPENKWYKMLRRDNIRAKNILEYTVINNVLNISDTDRLK